jgi:hypothetical protein
MENSKIKVWPGREILFLQERYEAVTAWSDGTEVAIIIIPLI